MDTASPRRYRLLNENLSIRHGLKAGYESVEEHSPVIKPIATFPNSWFFFKSMIYLLSDIVTIYTMF